MSFIDASKFTDFQSEFNQNERRVSKYGLIDMAKKLGANQDYISPDDLQRHATVSGARDIKLPVIKETTATVVTTPGFNSIPINLGESGVYNFTAYDVFSGFRFHPSMFENNQLSAQFYFESTLDRVLRAMATAKSDVIESVLELRKTRTLGYTTQISQGDGTYNFNTTDDTLEINKAAQNETMLFNLTTLMDSNKLSGEYGIVTSPAGLVAQMVAAAKYGQANEKNLQWAMDAIPSDMRFVDHAISTSANFNGFLVRDGGIGLAENYPWDFRNGTAFAGKEWMISDVAMPYVNSRLNMFINREAADNTSIVTGADDTNGIMSHWEEVALWDRFYVFYRYNSDLDTLVNDIVKIEGQTS